MVDSCEDGNCPGLVNAGPSHGTETQVSDDTSHTPPYRDWDSRLEHLRLAARHKIEHLEGGVAPSSAESCTRDVTPLISPRVTPNGCMGSAHIASVEACLQRVAQCEAKVAAIGATQNMHLQAEELEGCVLALKRQVEETVPRLCIQEEAVRHLQMQQEERRCEAGVLEGRLQRMEHNVQGLISRIAASLQHIDDLKSRQMCADSSHDASKAGGASRQLHEGETSLHEPRSSNETVKKELLLLADRVTCAEEKISKEVASAANLSWQVKHLSESAIKRLEHFDSIETLREELGAMCRKVAFVDDVVMKDDHTQAIKNIRDELASFHSHRETLNTVKNDLQSLTDDVIMREEYVQAMQDIEDAVVIRNDHKDAIETIKRELKILAEFSLRVQEMVTRDEHSTSISSLRTELMDISKHVFVAQEAVKQELKTLAENMMKVSDSEDQLMRQEHREAISLMKQELGILISTLPNCSEIVTRQELKDSIESLEKRAGL